MQKETCLLGGVQGGASRRPSTNQRAMREVAAAQPIRPRDGEKGSPCDVTTPPGQSTDLPPVLARRIARRPVIGQNERQVRRLAWGRGDVTRTALLPVAGSDWLSGDHLTRGTLIGRGPPRGSLVCSYIKPLYKNYQSRSLRVF